MKLSGLILVAALAGAASPARAQTVCDDVHTLLGLAQTNFAAIKGKLDEETGRYGATFKLPNAANCSIEDDGDAARFACEWKYASQKEAKEAEAGLLASVRPCLTAVRERALNVPSSNALQWLAGTRFKLADEVSVLVSAYETKGLIGALGGVYILSFSVAHA